MFVTNQSKSEQINYSAQFLLPWEYKRGLDLSPSPVQSKNFSKVKLCVVLPIQVFKFSLLLFAFAPLFYFQDQLSFFFDWYFTLKARIHVFSPLYLVLKICIDSGSKKNKISSVLLNRLFETRTQSSDLFQVRQRITQQSINK